MKIRLKKHRASTLDKIRSDKRWRFELLVAERGLKNTRRNRRWLALVRVFGHHGIAQEMCETLAWTVINTWESTP